MTARFMADSKPTNRDGDRSVSTDYVLDMAKELANLARRDGRESVAYFLDLACQAAEKDEMATAPPKLQS